VGRLELLPPYDDPSVFNDLEGFSHVWVIWIAHLASREEWSPTVRPPRLGGNRSVGVFASRAPFRPNPVGLSLLPLKAVEQSASPPALVLEGVDMVDGTPVLDIKPYLPYSDAIPDARTGYAPSAPDRVLDVEFSPTAEENLRARGDTDHLRALITGMLELDPRPAYRIDSGTTYGFRLYDFDLKWRVVGDTAIVLALEPTLRK
ncbi:MAG: tRNA (N6-threonylcarbamoyladenosine(37)-N6)-methyltransferase TrmO, partial [Pseudomonadota bacterium]